MWFGGRSGVFVRRNTGDGRIRKASFVFICLLVFYLHLSNISLYKNKLPASFPVGEEAMRTPGPWRLRPWHLDRGAWSTEGVDSSAVRGSWPQRGAVTRGWHQTLPTRGPLLNSRGIRATSPGSGKYPDPVAGDTWRYCFPLTCLFHII